MLAELSFRNVLKVTKSLYLENKISIPENIFNRLNEAEQKRNTYTHSYYGMSNIRGSSMMRNKSVNRKKGFESINEEITTETINSFADEVNLLGKEIATLVSQIIKT